MSVINVYLITVDAYVNFYWCTYKILAIEGNLVINLLKNHFIKFFKIEMNYFLVLNHLIIFYF